MIDLGKLAGQGRAFSGARGWETSELEALVTLERERGIPRTVAADYIRNGILTLEDYDKAVKAEFVPKTLEDASAEAEASLKDHKFATEVPEVKVPTAKEAAKIAKAEAKAAKKAAKEAAKNE